MSHSASHSSTKTELDDRLQEPIAIIGMSCHLPGARNLDEYWELMIQGRSTVRELPEERLPRDLYYDPEKNKLCKSYSIVGSIVEPVDRNGESYRLTKEERELVDPVHMDLVHVVADAFAHADLDWRALQGVRGGVYVGHTLGSKRVADLMIRSQIKEAMRVLEESGESLAESADELATISAQVTKSIRERITPPRPDEFASIEASQCARWVSEAFKLDGPYLTMDAACSSTLAGIAYASQALRFGEIDMAVVGGASHIKSDSMLLFSKAQSVSGTGSRPFDDDADGLIAAEGYVAVVLKRLSQALQDGDSIQGVIRGVGISSDGRGKSLWAPRREGQVEAFRRAYSKQVSLDSIQYLEAHATSTVVGDSTELNALAEVLGEAVGPGRKIPIGSVKANIGHTLEPAGLAGLIKTVLCMQRRTIPPVIGLQTLNTKVDWSNSPFFPNRERMDWPAVPEGQPRRAGVNAFGIGGLNAHVVVEEFDRSPKKHHAPAIAASPRSVAGSDSSAVAVVGMGVVLPGALNREQFIHQVNSEETALHPMSPSRWLAQDSDQSDAAKWIGADVKDFEYDWKRHRIPPNQLRRADPLQFMVLDAVEQALDSFGFPDRALDRKRTSVIVGTRFCGEHSGRLQLGLRLPEIEQQIIAACQSVGLSLPQQSELLSEFRERLLNQFPALLDDSGSFTASSLASRITKTFDLMGGGSAIDAGDHSSLIALNVSRQLLLSGRNDLVICAAGQRSLGLFQFEQLALSAELKEAIQNQTRREGDSETGPGEGAVVLMLKRHADAIRDEDPILGLLGGIGVCRGDRIESAMTRAIQRAHADGQTTPSETQAHELAAKNQLERDRQELAAIASLRESDQKHPLSVRSSLGRFGDLGAAAGMVSVARSLAFLSAGRSSNDTSFASLASLRDQFPRLRLLSASPSDSNTCRSNLRLTGINSIGDGIACHALVLDQTSVEPERRAIQTDTNNRNPQVNVTTTEQPTVRLWFGSSGSVSELLALAEQLSNSGSVAVPSQIDSHASQFRLAIVYTDEQSLKRKATRFVQFFEHTKRQSLFETEGIYFGERIADGEIAFLFPGQGSQYAHMLIDWINESSSAAGWIREFNHCLTELELPTFESLVVNGEDQLGKDVLRTQLSMLIADALMLRTISELGIVADRISGHSFGEFPALLAAGVLDFRNAALATKHRCQSISDCDQVKGEMLSCIASREVAEEICGAIPDVFVANHNSPEQVVVGGLSPAIDRFEQECERRNIRAIRLPVPRPFHTPLMAPTQSIFEKRLAEITFGLPKTTFLSGVGPRYIAEPSQFPKQLVAQMTAPVQYVRQIEMLQSSGVQVWIEIGPSSVLSKIHRALLGEQHLILSMDDRKRSTTEMLTRLQAATLVHDLNSRRNPQAIPNRSSSHSLVEPTTVDASLEKTTSVKNPVPATTRKFHSTDFVGGELPDQVGDLPIIRLSGSPYEMGLQQGKQFAPTIRRCIDQFVNLAEHPLAKMLPDIILASEHAEEVFDSDSLQEIDGLATAVGVNREAIIALQLYLGWSDKAAGVQILMRSNSGASWIHGCNEDLPLGLAFSTDLTRCLQLRFPSDGVAYAAQAAAGQVLPMHGINAAGVCLSSATLADVEVEGTIAATCLRGSLVRSVLGDSRNANEAASVLEATKADDGWSFAITDANGTAIHLETTSGEWNREVASQDKLLCSRSSSNASSPSASSHADAQRERLKQLSRQTAEDSGSGSATILGWLRDCQSGRGGTERHRPTMSTICRVDNQATFVVDHAARRAWATGQKQAGPFRPLFKSPSGRELHEIPIFDWLSIGSRVDVDARTAEESASNPSCSADHSDWYLNAEQVAKEAAFTSAAQSNQGRICDRFEVRFVPQEFVPTWKMRDAYGDGLVIVGDNSLARRIAARAQDSGVRCSIIDAAQDVSTAIDSLDSQLGDHTPCHLLLLSGFDAVTSPNAVLDDWQVLRQSQILTPYLICQRWFQRLKSEKRLESGSIMAVTHLGGFLGIDSQIPNPFGGVGTGLIKGLGIEHSLATNWQFVTRAIDFASDHPIEETIDRIVDEVGFREPCLEVCYRDGKRLIPFPVRRPVELNSATPADLYGVWVITGGARGVTAEVARELGRIPGTKLNLIGSSPLSEAEYERVGFDENQLAELRKQVMQEAIQKKQVPIDAWSRVERALEAARNIQSFREAGIDVTYHGCDVSDRSALENILTSIRQTQGPIHGVIHGAGFEKAAQFAKKKPELVDRTIAAKVDGAVNLLALTAQDPLKYFVTFGSISGRFGAIGQTDYCVANEMVSKLISANQARRQPARLLNISWHSWGGVGMAMRPETRNAKELEVLRYMPVAEGIQHLLHELKSGGQSSEVVITDHTLVELHYYEEVVKRIISRVPSATASSQDHSPKIQSGRTIAFDTKFDQALVDGIAQRRVLSTVECPLPAGLDIESVSGTFLLVGETRESKALARWLRRRGCPTTLINPTDPEQAKADVERACRKRFPNHLWIMTGRDPSGVEIDSPTAWRDRSERGLLAVYGAGQAWVREYEKVGCPSASILACVSLGGDFGITQQPRIPEGGGLTGLLKSVRLEFANREWDRISVKIVDLGDSLFVDDDPPQEFLERIVAEGCEIGGPVEVGYLQGKRITPALTKQPAKACSTLPFDPGQVWIGVGGARGITRPACLEIAKRYGLKMHLVGSSRLDPDFPEAWRQLDEAGVKQLKSKIIRNATANRQSPKDAWRRIQNQLEIEDCLREYAELGLSCEYHTCDIRDHDAIRDTLETIRRKDGGIHGIVQGAGLMKASRFEQMPSDHVKDMIAVKADATVSLLQLTQQDDLRCFVAFGSISGRYGSNGDTHYAMGADLICKLSSWIRHQRPNVHAVGVHWHAWGEVGMMCRSANMINLKLMPPSEGVAHLMTELFAGTPEAEIVVTDDAYEEHLATLDKQQANVAVLGNGARAQDATGLPMIEQVTLESYDRVQAIANLHPTRDEYLKQHVYRNRPILPLVGAAEMLSEVASFANKGRRVRGLTDLVVKQSLRLFNDEEMEVRVRGERTSEGIKLALLSDFRNRSGRIIRSDDTNVSALAVFEPLAHRWDPLEISGDTWYPVTYPDSKDVIYHGSLYRKVREICYAGEESFARIDRIDLKEFGAASSESGVQFPSILIDSCMFAAGIAYWIQDESAVVLPTAIDQVDLIKPTSEGPFVSRIRLRETRDQLAVFDIDVFDVEEQIVLTIRGYQGSIISGVMGNVAVRP